MKRSLVFTILLCSLSTLLSAQARSREEGTIVRMRMDDCFSSQHPLLDSLSGSTRGPSGEQCPEYVLMTEKVVYVIVGKTSDQLIPLAETTRFHFQNNEVLVRIDDERRESHFHVKQMVLRLDWDRSQQLEEAEAVAMATAHRRLQDPILLGASQ
ncbi:MAG: hypothetical protein WAL71_09670 [Terriglobales bacterium]|jgi:hypothetical protein